MTTSSPDPATGSRQTPIYQSTAFVFQDSEHAARLFNLQEVGYIYSRLTNPTVAALQERIAILEGGVGAVCCSSGHAAQIMALFPLMKPGKNIIASTRLYGGTVTQFSNTIKRFGWSAKFVDFDDFKAIKSAIDEDTQAIFCEAIANPGGYITDLDKVASIADAASIPLIVDNTSATPYLCRPIEHGATIVVHSTTKYLTGNGTVTGGCVVDSGKFDWEKNAVKVTNWLESHPAIEKVTYAGLSSSPYYKRVEKICPKGAGGLFTISLKGGFDSCVKFVDNLDIFSHVANLGDSRSLVIHPASTTHRQLTTEQQKAAGTGPEIVRISIGIEDADDLISDLKQALDKSLR